MLKTIAAAGLAATFALSPLTAFAQTDTGAPMSDNTMAPMKPMAKPMHHPMHKTHMSKKMMHPMKPEAAKPM